MPGVKQAWCLTNPEIISWKTVNCERTPGGDLCYFTSQGYSTKQECENANPTRTCDQETIAANNSCERDRNPEYYATQAACSDNITKSYETCEPGTMPSGLSSYETLPSNITSNYYLKHVVENDIVTESYVCIRYDDNGTKEACIRGGNASYYGYDATNPTGNVAIIESTQNYFEGNEGSCDFNEDKSSCSIKETLGISATSNGMVYANECGIDPSGMSWCESE